MRDLVVEDLSVEYGTEPGQRLMACSDVDLAIKAGEFVTIIGPSGCGKSTLLHCMGGLLQPSGGRITFGDKPFHSPDPHSAAFVFQDYSLFPWKTVLDNIAIVLRFAGVSKRDALEKAAHQLDFVGLTDFPNVYPSTLSGGMQQRVAVARALAMEPRALLMDEPFGALDEQSRRALGYEMAKLLADTGQSVVLITHSLDEAIFWADRIVVMSSRPGKISEQIQVDAPRPRGLDFMMTPEFQDIRVRLFELIQLQKVTVDQGGTQTNGTR